MTSDPDPAALPPPIPGVNAVAAIGADVGVGAAVAAVAAAARDAPATPPPRRFPFAAVAIDLGLTLTLLVALSILLVSLVLLPALFASGGADADAVMQRMLPEVTLAAIGAMLLTAIAVWAIRRRSLPERLPAMPVRRAYAIALLGGAAIQAAMFVISWLLAALDASVKPSNAEPIQALAASTPWLAWACVVLVAPLAEELLFRHVLLRRFALAGRAVTGLVLTALVFALLHEPVPGDQPVAAWLGGLLMYTGMGMAFGGLYLWTGRLGATFTAHAVCNLLALALMAYSRS